MSKPWTDREIDVMLTLHGKGLTPAEIARKMTRRTAKGVMTKLAKTVGTRGRTYETDYSLGFYDGPPIGETLESVRLRESTRRGSQELAAKFKELTHPKREPYLTPFERQEQAIKRGIPLIPNRKVSPFKAERKWA